MSKGSGLLNYTTTIAVETTIAEIYSILARNRVTALMAEYDGAGNVTAISFKASTDFGLLTFRLPANPAAASNVLNQQVRDRKIPKRFLNDVPQARRIAWRIVRQWIEAQMALIQLGQVKLEQVFLPYVQNSQGQTVYEAFCDRKFEGLALPAPQN